LSIALQKDEFHLLRALVEQQNDISAEEDQQYLFQSRPAGLVTEMEFRNFGELYQTARNKGDSLPHGH
jgi:chemotaxis methyl-accepting protein methylase